MYLFPSRLVTRCAFRQLTNNDGCEPYIVTKAPPQPILATTHFTPELLRAANLANVWVVAVNNADRVVSGFV
jgi:hypothetical protein